MFHLLLPDLQRHFQQLWKFKDIVYKDSAVIVGAYFQFSTSSIWTKNSDFLDKNLPKLTVVQVFFS